MKKQFLVIGLGRFGSSICKELYKIGHEVLAIDLIPEHVDAVKDYVTYSAIADATDEASLQDLGVNNFDHAVVAIGENLQASVLATLILKEIGVPIVWVKARDLQHQMVLEKVGADLVIQPEFEMGIRVAHHMDSEKIIDYIDLSEDYSIIEWEASLKMLNKTLKELNITAKYRCMILAIKRGENVNIAPMPDDEVQKGDVLVVIGHRDDLKQFERKGL
ncbi:potassium channel family protein [Planococcus sp. CAU13]|uniref:potassium channel family protein n=1 Tax=Planococcus sp. CAU13 TaxID=1541197 RepID=UPI00052FEBA4|nr:TrkA family potassium uptake protein [Planococcus sp. CAU13]